MELFGLFLVTSGLLIVAIVIGDVAAQLGRIATCYERQQERLDQQQRLHGRS